MKSPPLLTIILPAYNNPEFTGGSAKTAILSTLQVKVPTRFILIDDAADIGEPSVGVFQALRAEHSDQDITIIRTRRNIGYPGSFSLGLHFSATELTLFLSNDMLLTPSYLKALTGVAALSPDYGCVRGTSVNTDGLPQHSVPPPSFARAYDDLQQFADLTLRVNGLDHVEDPLLCGDAVIIKRAVIDAIGIHDLALNPYFSDIDYGMRAQLAGFKLVTAKGGWLHHEVGGYAKRDSERFNLSDAVARDQRMQRVFRCWEVLRAKWGAELPEWKNPAAHPHSKDDMMYRKAALRNRDRVALRVEAPATLLEQAEVV